MSDTVLILRTCSSEMTSFGGFKWPESGPVEAPDWRADYQCGGGLHGLLWGEGAVGYLDLSPDAKWVVFRATAADVMHGQEELTDKCKAARGAVEYCGDRDGAIAYLYANGAAGKLVVFGTATAGDSGTATAGYRGTATAGYRGTATAGYSGTATAGDSGTATAGDRGTATAGYSGTATAGDSGTATAGDSGTATAGVGGTATAGDSGTATAGYRGTATAGVGGTATAGVGGVIAIQYWNGKRYKTRIAQVKDEDGDGELEPNTPYRLDDAGNFVAVQG